MGEVQGLYPDTIIKTPDAYSKEVIVDLIKRISRNPKHYSPEAKLFAVELIEEVALGDLNTEIDQLTNTKQ